MTIKQYRLEWLKTNFVTMPVGSKTLSVDLQAGVPILSALVRAEYKTQIRRFEFFRAGREFDPKDYRLIGTVTTVIVTDLYEDLWYLFEWLSPEERQ